MTNPAGRTIPAEFLNALHAWPVDELVGAEYSSGKVVMWTDVPHVDERGET